MTSSSTHHEPGEDIIARLRVSIVHDGTLQGCAEAILTELDRRRITAGALARASASVTGELVRGHSICDAQIIAAQIVEG